MKILIFLNGIKETSIPFELANKMAELTDLEILVMSFYDDHRKDIEIQENISKLPLQIKCLGADSRLDSTAWREFYSELKQGYDLVHTHHNFSGSIARILAKIQRIPIVNTEHRNHKSFTTLQNLVNASTLPLADKIIANSCTTLNSFRWYEKLSINDKKLRVIYNGVDVELIREHLNSTTRPKNDTTVRICSVGRMVPVKNQSTLLHAFDTLVDDQSNAELILIGNGPLRDDLESLAHDLNINERVQFTGNIPRNHVYRYFAQSDIFTMSSHSEGFCVAAVEAMAAGLPVVVSDIPVFHEVVGDCGEYADPDNPKDFTSKIDRLIQNDRCRKSVARSCRKRARNSFSIDQTIKEYLNVYRAIGE